MKLNTAVSARTFAVCVAVIAAAVYANSVMNGFALDDVYIVQMNGRVHDLTSFARIWLTPYWPFLGHELGLYRPLTIFLFAVQWSLGDGAPWVFHVTNIALHALVTTLAFLLLQRFTTSTAAFVGALVFAVHPVHTEAVANVVGQAELVAAAAIMAACLVHAGRPDGTRISWARRLALTVLFLVALTAKENAVVLPALLVLVDLTQRRVRLSRRGAREYAGDMWMPMFLLGSALALYLAIRYGVMDGSITGSNAAPAMPYLREEYRLLNALRAFPELLRLLFLPLDLAADYSPAVILPVDDVRPMVLLGALLVVVIVFLAVLTPWRPHIGFPAAWFIITIITVSNLFFPIGVLVAERTLYLPSFALSALIAFAWHAGERRGAHRQLGVAAAAVAVFVVLFGVRTWLRNPDWRNTNTVWEAMYRDHPHSYRSQWVRASLLYASGRPDLAERHYRLAHAIYDRDTQFTTDFANFLMSRGNYVEAVPLLEHAHAVGPRRTSTVSILAYAYVATGRYAEALDVLRGIEATGANLVTAMALRAYAHRGMGEQGSAIAAWRLAVRHSPDSPWRAWSFLARSLAFGGYPSEAIAAADSARITAPDAAARTTVDRLATALDAQCYSGPSAGMVPGDGFAAMSRAECDPLGEWFEFVPAAHSATSLHNATESSSIPLDPATSDP
jgi:protein O-mannosyl-transferase